MLNDLHLDIIQLILDYLTQQELLDTAFICQIYYQQLIRYLEYNKKIFLNIESDRDLRYAFENNLIISIKRINNILLDWNWGLYGACKGGHPNLIKFMIDKVESVLKKLQLFSINKHKTSELITDSQLWFHPEDFENKIKARLPPRN